MNKILCGRTNLGPRTDRLDFETDHASRINFQFFNIVKSDIFYIFRRRWRFELYECCVVLRIVLCRCMNMNMLHLKCVVRQCAVVNVHTTVIVRMYTVVTDNSTNRILSAINFRKKGSFRQRKLIVHTNHQFL